MDKEGDAMIGKLTKDILTGVDNETFDHGRVMGLLSFLTFFVLAFYDLMTEHKWQAMEFASGVSAMAVGFGVNLKLKGDTEPKA
jgi:hypothetical protein